MGWSVSCRTSIPFIIRYPALIFYKSAIVIYTFGENYGSECYRKLSSEKGFANFTYKEFKKALL
jgi:hypothetical protein